MFKKLFGFIFVSLVINSSFAAVIHHGVILDKKEWTTGKGVAIKVMDKPAKAKHQSIKPFLKKLHSDNPGFEYENVFAASKLRLPEYIYVDTQEDIHADVKAYIVNDTFSIQKYTIVSVVCIYSENGEDNDSPCLNTSYTIELDPQGYFDLELHRVYSYNFTEVGYYDVGSFIRITREGSITEFTTGDFDELLVVDPDGVK